jgi:hypothetical protein
MPSIQPVLSDFKSGLDTSLSTLSPEYSGGHEKAEVAKDLSCGSSAISV